MVQPYRPSLRCCLELFQLIDLHVGLRERHHLRQDIDDAQVLNLVPDVLHFPVNVDAVAAGLGLAIVHHVGDEVILGPRKCPNVGCNPSIPPSATGPSFASFDSVHYTSKEVMPGP